MRKWIQKPPLGVQINWANSIAKGLVVAWLFNECSGSKVYDLSNNQNTGTIYNALWKPARFGSGLYFDGTGDYVQATLPSVFSASNPITAVIFVKDLGSSIRGLLNVQGTAVNADQILCVYFDPANNRLSTSHAKTDLYSRFSGTITTSNWNHFVITHAGGNVRPTIYVNGVLNQATTGTSLSIFGTNVIQVGKGVSAIYDGLSQVDHVYLYNRVLSASEIAQLYRETFCMFNKRNVWD